MSRAAFCALWCFVLVLPWDVFTQLPVLGSIPRLVGLVASAVGVLHVLARRRVRPLSWFHGFAMLFVVWGGVSSFWSIDPDATRMRFVTSLQLLVLVWLIWEIAWSPERQRALLQAYVLGVCVAAVATMHNYVSGAAWFSYGTVETTRFVALNQDPNELGVILALGLPMAWYLGFPQPQRRISWVWRLYVPLGITGILLTGSRAAFLTALVALVIIPWTLGRVRLRTKVALYALAVGSVILATSFVPAASLERIHSTRADIEAGYFGGRIYIWMAGLEVARAHPLAGVGAGGFGAAVAPTLHYDMASHQTFLEILVEQGVVGLLLFFAVVGAAIKPLRHLPPLERRLWMVLLASLAVGSMSLHLGHRKQFWFVLGVLAAQVAQPTPGPLSSRRRLRGTPEGHLSELTGRREESAQGG
jgi:O-antigen ligase